MRITIPPLLWAQRLALVVLAVVAPWDTVASHSSPVNAVIIAGGWITWAAAAVSSLVVIPVALTALRITTPLLAIVALLAVQHDPGAVGASIALACSVVALACTFTVQVTDAMVQGSAFGKERRFALRTPVPHVGPAAVSWLLFVAPIATGPLLLATKSWILGAIVTAIGALLAAKVPKHLHRLSRRWLVIVPAGIVIHDHMVLAETMMVRRHELARVTSESASGDEADLTGGVLGSRIRIELQDATKVVLTQLAARTLHTTEALHVRSFSIAPRNRDAAFDALTQRTSESIA